MDVFNKIRQALNFIDSSNRDDWIKCGMAIKSELSESGFGVWNDWSSTADNYNAHVAVSTWKSFKSDGGITIATLFKLARDNGFSFGKNYIPVPPTAEQLAERKEKQLADETQKAKRRAYGAATALSIWNSNASPDSTGYPKIEEHPYLGAKEIKPHDARIYHGNLSISGMACDGALMLPISLDNKITSLQFINGKGEKRFLPAGEKGAYQIGNLDTGKPICIGEGFATGATTYEAKDCTAIVAFDAGNLLKTALAVRASNPNDVIILCADLDESGTGQRKATEAALAVGGLVAMPVFNDNKPEDATDFNDMAKLSGLAAVKRAIDSATKPVVQQQDSIQSKTNMPDSLEPEPLRPKLPPSDPYPVEALGEVLGQAAMAIHESVKAPLALCCQSILAAASLAAQAHFNIKLPWGEPKPISLFFLTVGESGERKSGVDNLVLGAAKAQERNDMEMYLQNINEYQLAIAAWNHASDAARKSVTNNKSIVTADDIQLAVAKCGDKPESPIAPLCFMTDPTVEGMYKQLSIGKPSVALFSDEGGLLIGGHALNSDNALKTMARWCKLWDGAPFDRVRSGDGAGVLYGRRMAFHQLAQPEVMNKLLSDRMANGQGLLARCLVASPQSTIGTRHIDKYESPGDRMEVKRALSKFKTLMETEPRTGSSIQELDPIELILSEEAQILAVAATNQFETLMAPGAELAELKDRTSKAVENACRIAAVLAVIDEGLLVRIIKTIYLERALILIQWYLAETLRIRKVAAIPQVAFDAELLSEWLRSRDLKQFRSKLILHSGPNKLREKPRLMAAINELVQNGYLVPNEKGVMIDGVKALKSWAVIHYAVV